MKDRYIFMIFFCVVGLGFLRVSLHKNDIQMPIKHSSGLVALRSVNPKIKTDLIYATSRNFTGAPVYAYSKCYLLDHVAQALSNVQVDLEKEGLGLLVWDAYRPMSAQKHFWQHCPDPRFIANPSMGGKHTRGTTVDLTLIDIKTGNQLEMPTGFDEFSERASSTYNNVPAHVAQNRNMLQKVMKKHGFNTIEREWWHFDYNDWQGHPPLEVEFNELT